MGFRDSDRTRRTCKLALLVMNGLFIAIGLLIIGLGIYLLLYKGDLLGIVFDMAYIRVSVIIIIFCGSSILIFSFIGLCAATLNHRLILAFYFVYFFLLALLAVAAVVMAIVYKRTWYIDEVRQFMREKIQKQYGVPSNKSSDNDFVTRTWDTLQQMWYCCGVEDESWGIYRQSQWYNNQPGDPGTKEYTAKMVPQSCCLKSQYGAYVDLQKCQNWQLGPPNIQNPTIRNEALLYSGCYVIGRKLLDMVAGGVIGLGIVTILCSIAAIVPSVILYINLSREDRSSPATQPVRTAYFAPAPTYPSTISSNGQPADGTKYNAVYDNPYISTS